MPVGSRPILLGGIGILSSSLWERWLHHKKRLRVRKISNEKIPLRILEDTQPFQKRRRRELTYFMQFYRLSLSGELARPWSQTASSFLWSMSKRGSTHCCSGNSVDRSTLSYWQSGSSLWSSEQKGWEVVRLWAKRKHRPIWWWISHWKKVQKALFRDYWLYQKW